MAKIRISQKSEVFTCNPISNDPGRLKCEEESLPEQRKDMQRFSRKPSADIATLRNLVAKVSEAKEKQVEEQQAKRNSAFEDDLKQAEADASEWQLAGGEVSGLFSIPTYNKVLGDYKRLISQASSVSFDQQVALLASIGRTFSREDLNQTHGLDEIQWDALIRGTLVEATSSDDVLKLRDAVSGMSFLFPGAKEESPRYLLKIARSLAETPNEKARVSEIEADR